MASLARGVPGAPPEGPNVTAKPVRPLLSRQFTAAVAAGPGGGRDQQASRSGDAHKGDGSYAHNDAAALVHRRGIRLRAVSAGEPCPGCSSCRGRPTVRPWPRRQVQVTVAALSSFFYGYFFIFDGSTATSSRAGGTTARPGPRRMGGESGA